VSKGCGETPLLPISTGTNNVFPYMIEGTMAGLAAGILASNRLARGDSCRQRPRLEIYKKEDLIDIALVDLVVTDESYVGARAIWEMDSIREVFLTGARPDAIGFSSLGGYLHPLPPNSRQGLHIRVGPGGKQIKAPIAPGLICSLPIASHGTLDPGEAVLISESPAVIALDGEREIITQSGDRLTVCLNPWGPHVVDTKTVLTKAAERNFFITV
jgi:predicted polyphosphate/ATP-dependent NAD kinase